LERALQKQNLLIKFASFHSVLQHHVLETAMNGLPVKQSRKKIDDKRVRFDKLHYLSIKLLEGVEKGALIEKETI
jgi:hypothetical protein